MGRFSQVGIYQEQQGERNSPSLVSPSYLHFRATITHNPRKKHRKISGKNEENMLAKRRPGYKKHTHETDTVWRFHKRVIIRKKSYFPYVSAAKVSVMYVYFTLIKTRLLNVGVFCCCGGF